MLGFDCWRRPELWALQASTEAAKYARSFYPCSPIPYRSRYALSMHPLVGKPSWLERHAHVERPVYIVTFCLHLLVWGAFRLLLGFRGNASVPTSLKIILLPSAIL